MLTDQQTVGCKKDSHSAPDSFPPKSLELCNLWEDMKPKTSIQWPFFCMGIAFWAYTRDVQPMTVLIVFYSFFVGLVWDRIPIVSGTESMNWRHLLPPFILLALMMVSTSMKTIPSSSFIALTAMALIHLRAAVLSVTRMGVSGLSFTLFQTIAFIWVIVDLFQNNLLSFLIPERVFVPVLMALGMMAIVNLFQLKRKRYAKGSNPVSGNAVDSGMLP